MLQYSKLSPRFIGLNEVMDNFFDDIPNWMTPNESQFANIIRYKDSSYDLEIIAPGYAPDDLDITFDKSKGLVKVDGKLPEKESEEGEYISTGHFIPPSLNLSFRVAEHYEVSSASHKNGVLTIKFVKNIPEELQPVKIEIESELSSGEKEVLMED